MAGNSNTPEIRFKGFTDPWEQRKLGELCEINPTTALPDSFEYVDLESVVGTDMISHRREERSTAPSRAQRLASFGDIFYQTVRPYQKNNYFYELPDEDFVFSTGYAQLRPLCDGRFLFASLQREQFVSHVLERCTGTSYPAINANDLATLFLSIPNDLREQRLVGSILKPIDSLITLTSRKHEKLVQMKKAMLDKMFPKPGEQFPEIRFKGFTDPWEQRKLGELSRRVTRKNAERESDLPLTISAQYGLVDQRTFFNNQVASKDMSGYYLLRNGEFAYNKSTSSDSPWGAIKRLVKYDKGCVSTLYICFELLGADPDYLVTYYETNRWHKAVQLIAAEGARNHGLLNIAPDDFFETQLTIPADRAEQKAIGSYFANLDSLITLHQRKLELLRNIKKAMLDKMFV